MDWSWGKDLLSLSLRFTPQLWGWDKLKSRGQDDGGRIPTFGDLPNVLSKAVIVHPSLTWNDCGTPDALPDVFEKAGCLTQLSCQKAMWWFIGPFHGFVQRQSRLLPKSLWHWQSWWFRSKMQTNLNYTNMLAHYHLCAAGVWYLNRCTSKLVWEI